MPTIEQHLDKADRDLDAYKAIPEGFPEWRAVALFYSAVHSIEALCATGGSIHIDHYAREKTIKKEHPKLWPRYIRLKQESEKARYLTRRHRKALFSLNASQVDKQLFEGCLLKIRDYVRGQMPTTARATSKP